MLLWPPKKQWMNSNGVDISREVRITPTYSPVIDHNPFAGIHNLRRYFKLVIFQAYLDATTPDTVRDMATFESFVKHRPGQHHIKLLLLLLSLANAP